MSNQMKTFDSTFAWIFSSFILFILLILFFPYLFTQLSWFSWGFSEKPGEIGDAIGGTLGPFVAISAAILTFFAFWVQFKANEQQKNDLKTERFENKFYEILRLHRANVEEMSIADRVVGRKCFVKLFNEFRYCYIIINDQYEAGKVNKPEVFAGTEIDILELAYTIFFYGIGDDSEKQFHHQLSEVEKKLYESSRDIMSNLQDRYSDAKGKNPSIKYYSFKLLLTETPDELLVKFYYQPFDGHTDLLGHYYRHLYQTVSYVVGQEGEYFSKEVKYSYVKTLRAQLSNHEQLMLYYNSASWFDDQWKVYFTDYRLIKNLPLGLADFGEKPEEKYKDDIKRLRKEKIEMFELHE
jgi:hypothetical protein